MSETHFEMSWQLLGFFLRSDGVVTCVPCTQDGCCRPLSLCSINLRRLMFPMKSKRLEAGHGVLWQLGGALGLAGGRLDGALAT